MATVPFVLEGFEPMERLGGGGFGEVWLARQVNIDRKVAIKVGHAPIDDKTVQLRFERECIALGRLSGHPNIVDVYTAGSMTDGRPYLVLEYVSGGTLWQRLQSQPLTEAQLVKVAAELAAALTVAHSSGILHRDLKPENVLIRANGDAVLGDFGIARLHDGANTTSHAITASVAYAPPEVLSGGTASVASDIYGIGICLLASVIRSVPFVASGDESIHPIINRVLTDRPPDLRQHGVSPDLNELIHQLLAKDPGKRPPSAEEVKHRLDRLLATGSPPPPPSAFAPSPFAADSGATRPMGATTAAPAYAPAPPPAAAGYNTAPGGYNATPGGYNPAASGYNPGGYTNPGAATAGGYPDPTGYAAPRPAPPAPPASAPAGFSGSNDYRGPDPTGGVTFSPIQSQPYARPPLNAPLALRPDHEMNRLRLFGAVFGATLLLGGLLLFALLRLFGSHDDSPTPSSVVTGDTTAQGLIDPTDVRATVTDTTATVPVPSSTTGATPLTGPLILPLAEPDLSLTAPESRVDTAGPNSIQYCDNTPATTGLTDWVAQTSAGVLGFPSVFQQLARFGTEAQASAYVEAYLGTVDCADWVLPENDDGPEVTIHPRKVPAATVYGDDTREISFDGVSGFLPLYGRVAIVRRSTAVYLVSITSIVESDLDDLDRLLSLAAPKLGA